jgi:hypothetical protein
MSTTLDVGMRMKKEFQVVKSYAQSKQKNTIILSIPHELAKQYGFDVPQHLLMVPRDDGILIKKLNTDGIE